MIYHLIEAVKGMWRAKYMTFLSIFTVTITLYVVGVFGLATLTINRVIEYVRGHEEVNIYLSEEIEEQEALELQNYIESFIEVSSTRYLSKEAAAEEFELVFRTDVLRASGRNPLPRTIIVNLEPGYQNYDDMRRFAERINLRNGVDAVDYGEDWVAKLDFFYYIFLTGELLLAVLALIASLVVISNTITMTVVARKERIEIMKLVGATKGFIRRPFYFEGVLQGVVSGIIAFGFVFATSMWIKDAVPGVGMFFADYPVPKIGTMNLEYVSALIIPFGGLMGIIGSLIAVRRAI